MFLVVTRVGCNVINSIESTPDPVPTYETYEVAAKTIRLVNDTDTYVFAFTDGTDAQVGFGVYTATEVGDKVCFRFLKSKYLGTDKDLIKCNDIPRNTSID